MCSFSQKQIKLMNKPWPFISLMQASAWEVMVQLCIAPMSLEEGVLSCLRAGSGESCSAGEQTTMEMCMLQHDGEKLIHLGISTS